MALTVRVATQDEADAILRLWVAADAEPTHTDDVEAPRALIMTGPAALLVAKENNETVGRRAARAGRGEGARYRTEPWL